MRRHTCWAPFELAALQHENGDVEVEQKILEVGRKTQMGGAGEFEVTPDHVEEMVRNFESDAAVGYQPPAVVGHPRERDQAPAVGWVTKLRAAQDGLYATVRFLKRFAERVKAGEFRYSSPSFTFRYTDERGEKRGAKLLDLGILNNPFQKATGAFVLSEVGNDPEEQDMADEKNATAELTEKVAGLTTEIESKDAELAALREERDGIQVQLTEKDAEIVDLREKLTLSETELERRSIGDVIRKGLQSGKLTPAQVPGFEKDGFDAKVWLSESGFSGVEGLSKFIATAPPVVDLSASRKAKPSSNDGTDDRERAVELQAAIEAAKAINPALTDAEAHALAEKALS